MNEDILEGQWRQVRGQMKMWWGKLTDNDLERVEGNYDKLVGVLQERYGYNKAQAEAEITRRLNEYKTQHASRSQSMDQGRGQHDQPM